MPLISIIIPVYNTMEYISKALTSCIEQTFSNIEIICINDGSTDYSLKVIDKFVQNDKRIKVINQEHQGVSAARNLGIKNANGKYLIFLDSDDWLNNTTCEKIANKFSTTNFDVMFYNIKSFTKSSIRKKYSVRPYQKTDNYNLVYSNDWICACYNKDFIEKHNICFPTGIAISEDHIFKLQVLYNNPKIETCNDFLYCHLADRESSATKNWSAFLAEQVNSFLFLKNTDFFKNLDIKQQMYITDIWGFYIFCTWVKYPKKYLNKEHKNIIKSFLQLYKKYEYKEYKNMYGYKLLKYKYFCKFFYSLRNILRGHKIGK